MRLPEKFVERMQQLLKEEWPSLLAAWERSPYAGLRVNTLKITPRSFQEIAPFALEPVPWTTDGFYYSDEVRPAKHPFFYAGLYYLQEPSAMAPAACLEARPGDKVLDLCAAPGGKSTQLLGQLAGEGLLVSNEINTARAKALTWNLERWGAVNAVVTNESPERLLTRFEGFFDKILVDAPCSGEGMFSRDKRACASWTDYNNADCSVLQKDILESAAGMLKPGGKMIYSTCTFSPEEDEGVIAHFLKKNHDFQLLDLPCDDGWAPGFDDQDMQLSKTRRLWPHKVRGEGHFLASLTKDCPNAESFQHVAPNRKMQDMVDIDDKRLLPLAAFMAENLTRPLAGPFYLLGDYIYKIPVSMPSLQGLKVLRYGWFLGNLKNGRFEPSQALALGLKREDAQRSISFASADEEVFRYLKGETVFAAGEKGWSLVCVEGFPLGWAKQTGDTLKNYYPPSWRITAGRGNSQ